MAKKKHVAVFVFPFGTRAVPLFNLILKLSHASPNTIFSFFGTQQSNKPLSSKPNNPNNVKFYCIGDGVPEGHVLGSDPVEKVNLFLQAGHENLQKGIDMAIGDTKDNVITCIIADAFVIPSFFLAQKLNVPWIPVWISLSCALSAHFYTDLIRQKCDENNAKERALDFLPGLSKICLMV